MFYFQNFSHIENIVFIDDFSGSGKSFIDELKKNSKEEFIVEVFMRKIEFNELTTNFDKTLSNQFVINVTKFGLSYIKFLEQLQLKL
mgnify:CR=1 FL=1